jgi:hypothetical protein
MLLRPQRGMLTSTLLLSIVVNLCAWAWFVSLPLTDPMVNTVIYQSCCVWCFLISVVVLNERVTCIKVLLLPPFPPTEILHLQQTFYRPLSGFGALGRCTSAV